MPAMLSFLVFFSKAKQTGRYRSREKKCNLETKSISNIKMFSELALAFKVHICNKKGIQDKYSNPCRIGAKILIIIVDEETPRYALTGPWEHGRAT